MTEGVMAAATDQAERLSNLDINHAQSVLAKAKETHQELSDQAKLLSNPNYDADTAASEAEDYVKAVREGTDGALLKVSIEKEQAERHLHHAKEFAAQETTKTAQLVEPLQAELAAKLAGEAEITAKTDVEQIVAAQKGVAQEGTYTNKMLSKEKDLIDKVRALEKETRSQHYKIKALQLQKRLLLEQQLQQQTDAAMQDRVKEAIEEAGVKDW